MDRYAAIAQLRLIRASRQAALKSYTHNTRGLGVKDRRQAVAGIKADIEALDFAIVELDPFDRTMDRLREEVLAH